MASADRGREIAERARRLWRSVALGHRLRAALPDVGLRDAIFPCVVMALVGLQIGGLQTHPPITEPAPILAHAPRIAAQAPLLRTPDTPVAPVEARTVGSAAVTPVARFEPPRAAAVRLARKLAAPPSRQSDAPRSQPAASMMTEPVGTLVIESEPSGAQVYLNQQPAGITPLTLPNTRARAYAVRIDADGYARWSRGIYVVMNQQTRITARLEVNR